MTINGNRRFNYNGKRYFIQNLPKADIEGDKKYCVTVEENGFYKIAYGIGFVMEKFATIKDAQRYVRDWDFCLETL